MTQSKSPSAVVDDARFLKQFSFGTIWLDATTWALQRNESYSSSHIADKSERLRVIAAGSPVDDHRVLADTILCRVTGDAKALEIYLSQLKRGGLLKPVHTPYKPNFDQPLECEMILNLSHWMLQKLKLSPFDTFLRDQVDLDSLKTALLSWTPQDPGFQDWLVVALAYVGATLSPQQKVRAEARSTKDLDYAISYRMASGQDVTLTLKQVESDPRYIFFLSTVPDVPYRAKRLAQAPKSEFLEMLSGINLVETPDAFFATMARTSTDSDLYRSVENQLEQAFSKFPPELKDRAFTKALQLGLDKLAAHFFYKGFVPGTAAVEALEGVLGKHPGLLDRIRESWDRFGSKPRLNFENLMTTVKGNETHEKAVVLLVEKAAESDVGLLGQMWNWMLSSKDAADTKLLDNVLFSFKSASKRSKQIPIEVNFSSTAKLLEDERFAKNPWFTDWLELWRASANFGLLQKAEEGLPAYGHFLDVVASYASGQRPSRSAGDFMYMLAKLPIPPDVRDKLLRKFEQLGDVGDYSFKDWLKKLRSAAPSAAANPLSVSQARIEIQNQYRLDIQNAFTWFQGEMKKVQQSADTPQVKIDQMAATLNAYEKKFAELNQMLADKLKNCSKV